MQARQRLRALTVLGSSLGVVLGTSAMIVGVGATAASATPAKTTTTKAVTDASSSCNLGTNGVKHVIEVFFDNVHFNRDNPNVPSDIEQIPTLKNFIENNGTLLSNSHTPLIAHTSVDSLTNYSGLYGDRQGMGVGNTYEYYRSDGSGDVNQGDSFVAWNSPIIDEPKYTVSTQDKNPSQVYSATVPATPTTSAATGVDTAAPAPWVPFTRAGCDVGDVSTANMTLENTADIATTFGASSPEEAELKADDSYGDATTADYLGLSVHCAKGDSFCASATGVKYGQTTASPTAVTDSLPDEPGGYTGYQQLVGHRYVAPQLGAGTDNLTNAHGYPVTNAAGNLVDLDGNELDGQYTGKPGFPGFGPIVAAQSLAYTADLQESGVPVTYAYIGDVHEKKTGDTGCTNPVTSAGGATGPGDPCSVENTKQYDKDFSEFFARLAADGINKSNTLFVFASDEGDHFDGANVGRAITPNCSGTQAGAPSNGYQSTASGTDAGGEAAALQIPNCWYADTTSGGTTTHYIGEDEVSAHGVLSAQEGDNTPFTIDSQGPVVFAEGNQSTATVRQLERDFGKITVNNPYENNANDPAIRYLADPTTEALLHYVDADPARTPSFTAFPDPDIYFAGPSGGYITTSGTNSNDSPGCASGTTASNANVNCAQIASRYAWDHGYYTPEVNTNWVGLVGPGVANNGLDGPDADNAAILADQSDNGTGSTTVPTQTGTWADQTDVRPTILALTGLKDDYTDDGGVLYQDLTISPNGAGTAGDASKADIESLEQCYKQLNASVGRFGNDILTADNNALRTGTTSDDSTYTTFLTGLKSLGTQRDKDATQIKGDLASAEFGTGLASAQDATDLTACNTDLTAADALANIAPPTSLPDSKVPVVFPVLGVVVALGAAGFVARRRRSRTA